MAGADRGAVLRGLQHLCSRVVGSATAAAPSRSLLGGSGGCRALCAFPATVVGGVARIGLPRASFAHWPRRPLSAEATAAADAASAQPVAEAALKVCIPAPAPPPRAHPITPRARSSAEPWPAPRVTLAWDASCAEDGEDTGRSGGTTAAEGQELGRTAAHQGLRPPGSVRCPHSARTLRCGAMLRCGQPAPRGCARRSWGGSKWVQLLAAC